METATYLVTVETHDGHEVCFEVESSGQMLARAMARQWHPHCKVIDIELVRGSKRPAAPDPTTVAGARYYTGQ